MNTRKLNKFLVVILFWGFLSWTSSPLLASSAASLALKALIVTGQNNHDWKTSSSILKQILEDTNLFEVATAISPPQGGDMSVFSPDFASYQLVVIDYNGDEWTEPTQKAFVDFVRIGGGVVIFHAANNSFPRWKEYNQITGLGGWGSRDELSGPYVFWDEGKIVRDPSPGIGGYHGSQHAFLVVNRDTSHPITRGLPEKWMHAKDELYSLLRGPAENIHILATAYSDPSQLGTGRDEPVLFTVSYGKGRIFHTVLGHAAGEIRPSAIECVGFIVTFQRGAEWAATGEVTQKIPGDFPAVYRDYGTPDDVRQWKDYRQPDLKKILDKVSTYEYGQDEEILSQLRDYVRACRNSPESRKQCEEQLAQFLESKATLAAKMAVCRHLRVIGTSLSVPALERMLLQSEASDVSRYALEKIPGDSADRALIQGLSKSKGKLRVGIISSLGQRRAEGSVLILEKLLYDPDVVTATAAAQALGQIASPEAVNILSKALTKTSELLKARTASSLLKCAEERSSRKDLEGAAEIYDKLLASKFPLPIHQAAMKGKIAASGNRAREMIVDALSSKDVERHEPAISLVREVYDESNIQEVCALLPNLPASSQVQLLEVLSRFRAKVVLSSVIQALKSKDEIVRVAALEALENLGDASTVELLVQHAAKSSGKEQKAARNSLLGRRGDGVDQAILLNLVKQQDQDIQEELIMSVGERRIHEGLNLLLARTLSPNAKNRVQAIKSLKSIASPSDLPQLVPILLNMREEREKEEMANTIAAVAAGLAEPVGRARDVVAALSSVDDIKGRCALYMVLGKVGDDSSLSVLRKALSEGNEEEHDAAVRALADWPKVTPKEDLLEIVQISKNPTHRVLALRAYIRMIGMEPYRAPEQAVQELEEVLGLARIEEKKLILGILPQFACEDGLKLTNSLLAEEGVEAEARLAAEKITEKLKKEGLKK